MVAALPCQVSITGRQTAQGLGISSYVSSSVFTEQDVSSWASYLAFSVPCFSHLQNGDINRVVEYI